MGLSPQRVGSRWLRRFARGQLFRTFVDGRKFQNPETDNSVQFESLPKEEQARIFREWRHRDDESESERASPRGIVPVDKKHARQKASEIAGKLTEAKFRDPDDSLWMNRTQPWPMKATTIRYRDVKGHEREVEVSLDIAPHDPESWREGRKFVVGGSLQHRHHGEHDPGWATGITVKLDRDKTPKDLADGKKLLEDEIYNVLIHELTHARDHLTPAQTKKHQRGRDPKDPKVYYNDPNEVKAFSQQAVDEIESTLDRMYGGVADDDDDPWVPDAADLFHSVIDQSRTWQRVKPHMDADNRRKLLRSVYDSISEFRKRVTKKKPT